MNAQTHGRKIPSIGDYYSATQLRADRWSALREAVEALSRHGVEGRQGQKILATVEELFEALAPIELYWAFPGASAFDHLRRLFDNRNFEDLMTVIRRVARALTSGAYRRRSIPLVADELDAEDYEDESAISPEARALGSIATNLEFFDRAVNAVADSTTYAGSAMREYNARSQTFAANTQRFRNMVTELSVAIGNALIPALTRLMEIFAPMVTKLAELAAAYPEVTTAIVGTAAAVVALKVASAGLSYLGLVGRGGLLSGIALGYRTIGRASIHLSTAARETIRYNAALAAMSGASVSRIGTVAAGMRGIGLAVPGVAALSGALTAIGAALGAITAPVWATFAAIVAAIAAAGLSIYRYWDRLSAIFSGVGRRLGEAVLPAFEGLRPVLEWFAPMGETIANGWRRLTGIFTGLGSAISGMFSREVLTDDQRQTWEQWAYQLTDSFIAGIASIPTRIREALAPMTQAGRALVQAFWDGMTAVFGELIACRIAS